jgi:hypothetical protein
MLDRQHEIHRTARADALNPRRHDSEQTTEKANRPSLD